MQSYGIAEASLAGNLAGFSLGVVISVLLLVLTLRAVRLPGTPLANVFLAVCALMWNVGGLISNLQRNGPLTHEPPPSFAMAIQFTGAALWPLPLLAVWRHLAVAEWQHRAWRVLQVLATISATVIVGGVWLGISGLGVARLMGLKELAAYSSTSLLIAAGLLLLRGKPASRAVLFSTTLVLAGLILTTISVVLGSNVSRDEWAQCILAVTGQQSVLLIVIGTFFLFARFRFADLLIRYTVKIFLASINAAALVFVLSRPAVRNFTVGGHFPVAGRFIAMVEITTVLMVVFPLVNRSLGKLIEAAVFHAPDYRDAARSLGDSVRGLFTEQDVIAAAEEAVRNTLSLDNVRCLPFETAGLQWPPEIHDGQVVEVPTGCSLSALTGMGGVEVLVPVRAGGTVAAVLAIAPGCARRTLVSHEVTYLQNVAVQLGTRLDLLRLEQAMVERRNRETVLQQQVTDAELRALRAQINPHFLFNSLNTIANLIATDPPRAEVMTLRLARVFRHVLANSSRQMVSVHEEMEFLRTYLEIEEARFGNRLNVEINVAPEVAQSQVPSLILQPVVENALRHGLGPKTGPGHLKISATCEGDLVCLSVEDDGVGTTRTSGREEEAGGGVGLRNIMQRLTALYRDGARMTVQPGVLSGTRVTLLMPQAAVVESAAVA